MLAFGALVSAMILFMVTCVVVYLRDEVCSRLLAITRAGETGSSSPPAEKAYGMNVAEGKPNEAGTEPDDRLLLS